MTKSFAVFRTELRDLLVEDLVAGLIALRDALPENSPRHAEALVLLGRLKDANRMQLRNNISPDDYARRIDTLRSDAFDWLMLLNEADFEASASGQPSAHTGTVLYRVPRQMPMQKSSICLIRVARDEEALMNDLVIDGNVRLRPQIEVSETMKAEIIDLEGEVFNIRALNEPEQLIRQHGYTQWLFRVTPLIEGEHQLLIKIAMLEFVAALGRFVPREISLMETVMIVTGPGTADEGQMKSAGYSLVLGPEEPSSDPYSGAATNTESKETMAAREQGKTSVWLRSLVVLAMFVFSGSAITLAFTPAHVRDWWITSWKDSAAAYDQYIEAYRAHGEARSYVEKAYYYKILKTRQLNDLRRYEEVFPNGTFQSDLAGLVLAEPVTDSASGHPVAHPAGIVPRQDQIQTDTSIRRNGQPIAPGKPTGAALPGLAPTTEESMSPASSVPVSASDLSAVLNNLVFIPKGSFHMGLPASGADSTLPRLVSLKKFYISRYEVTNGEFCRFLNEKGNQVEGSVSWIDLTPVLGDGHIHFVKARYMVDPGFEQHPVVYVTWFGAQAYCRWLSEKTGYQFRLPTEAEWEYAAKGGPKNQESAFAGGNNLGAVGWYEGNSGFRVHTVGTQNPNILGLYDMSGNVWEWCADLYQAAPTGTSGATAAGARVVRGGAWSSVSRFCMITYRGSYEPTYRIANLGFRVVRALR